MQQITVCRQQKRSSFHRQLSFVAVVKNETPQLPLNRSYFLDIITLKHESENESDFLNSVLL